ncbi:MAG: hypothetical protein NXI18_22155 [Alphaproteobacteria bacterium]|nr:hypothetical protein [Alphaproteobacteria bacterium]
MATQTCSETSLQVPVPIRALRVRIVRLIARRRALRALAEIGVTGPQARLLAREMGDRTGGKKRLPD